ncbi:MAG TPA: (d)CMP kinase [Firmicutes bacterium]|nr:(d)CMP kinase [Bacillota bacterium]
MKNFVIAIDGPAGAGKSTVAKIVAEKLGFLYVDTGAMYRALTLKAMKKNIDFRNKEELIKMAENTDLKLYQDTKYRVILDGEDVSEEIRKEEVSKNTHFVASIFEIREILWEMQRSFRETSNIVMEGRDIGSKVFPDAQLKIYLDASVEERAKRRYLQLKEKGEIADIEEIKKEVIERDKKDRNRKIAPLVKLPDAVYIDTTNLTIEEVVERIINLYHQKLNSSG